MIRPKPCAVPPEAYATLAQSDYADAFEAVLPGKLTPLLAARKIVGGSPAWVKPLLALRNVMVMPFGLVSGNATKAGKYGKIGFFPVMDANDTTAVLGLDDKHLDFRLVVSVAPAATDETHVTVSTVLLRHNLLGRVYLAAVLPFHRLIVPAFMRAGQRR